MHQTNWQAAQNRFQSARITAVQMPSVEFHSSHHCVAEDLPVSEIGRDCDERTPQSVSISQCGDAHDTSPRKPRAYARGLLTVQAALHGQRTQPSSINHIQIFGVNYILLSQFTQPPFGRRINILHILRPTARHIYTSESEKNLESRGDVRLEIRDGALKVGKASVKLRVKRR